MKGLNFRKKRRKKGGRPGAHKKSGAAVRHLRFENKKDRLHFAQEQIHISPKSLILWAVEILIVCMTAVLLVAAFGQRVSTAGDSMSPVLKNGDVVLINRFIYNVKSPSRGDIVAYRQEENGRFSVKRIAGLPGETVQIVDGQLLINGELPEKDIYVSDIEFAGEAAEPVELGEDEYFLIGDNHTASDDSRLPNIGSIKRDDIYGQVWFVVKPAKDFGFV